MSISALSKKLEGRLLHDEPLAKYTAARLGGNADWLYIAKESPEELAEVAMTAWNEGIPLRILGGGANVLVSDCGVRGLVIINRTSQIEFGEWHSGRKVCASAGTSLSTLAHKCQARGLTGFEWAVSVPGTLGGAIVNNAGAHGSDMSKSLADVVVMEKSGPKLYSNQEMEYSYRHSVLKSRADRDYIVLLATLVLQEDDPAAIKAHMDEMMHYRKKTQPPGASLGSIFKNPEGDYAGRLIEAAGLKGHRIGNAKVSEVHANFFISGAERGQEVTAADYRQLIEYVQQTVFDKFAVTLEPEIEFVGEWK